MGLFDKIKSAFVSADGKVAYPSATSPTRPEVVTAPASGAPITPPE